MVRCLKLSLSRCTLEMFHQKRRSLQYFPSGKTWQRGLGVPMAAAGVLLPSITKWSWFIWTWSGYEENCVVKFGLGLLSTLHNLGEDKSMDSKSLHSPVWEEFDDVDGSQNVARQIRTKLSVCLLMGKLITLEIHPCCHCETLMFEKRRVTLDMGDNGNDQAYQVSGVQCRWQW